MPIENPGEGSGNTAEVGSRDSGFAEMSEGYFQEAPPAQPEPAGSQPTPTGAAPTAPPPAATGAQPKTTSGQPPTAPQAEPRRYRVGGKEYTVAELEQQGLLDRALTQAEQVAHYQKLYEEGRERERTAAEAAKAQQGTQPGQPSGPSTEQLVAHYQTHIADAVKQGFIEEEAAALFPKTTSRMFWLSDMVQNNATTLGELHSWISKLAQYGQSAQFVGQLESACDTASKLGPMYADLADASKRQPFIDWLHKNQGNTPQNVVGQPEYIPAMWAAYKHQDWAKVAETASAAQRASEEERRRNAQGEGGGTRPTIATAPDKKQNDLNEMMADQFPQFVTR